MFEKSSKRILIPPNPKIGELKGGNYLKIQRKFPLNKADLGGSPTSQTTSKTPCLIRNLYLIENP